MAVVCSPRRKETFFTLAICAILLAAACNGSEDAPDEVDQSDDVEARDSGASDARGSDASVDVDAGDTSDGAAGDAATDGGASDGASTVDAGDAGDADASTDAGTFVPVPGAPCTTIGEIYTERCGKCGTRTASCSPSKVVTGYGQCSEPVDACEPGAMENQAACGFCGTTRRTCNDQCVWVEGGCEGEVTAVDRCTAGIKMDRTEGCTGGVTRSWTCSATCAWVEPTLTCEEAGRVLVIGGTVGAVTSRDAKMLDETMKRLLSSGTAPCSLSASSDTHYAYLEVKNPNATAAKVELGAKAQAGQPDGDALMAAYTTPPGTNATDRKNCINGADAFCNADIAYGACLFGSKAVTVPAGGSIWVYVGNFSVTDAPWAFTLTAKVVAL